MTSTTEATTNHQTTIGQHRKPHIIVWLNPEKPDTYDSLTFIGPTSPMKPDDIHPHTPNHATGKTADLPAALTHFTRLIKDGTPTPIAALIICEILASPYLRSTLLSHPPTPR